jgi:serine/threonine-protein kinase RsbW
LADDGHPGTMLFRGELTTRDLTKVRHQLTAWARLAGLDQDTTDAVVLSGYEALANTVQHAYREEGRGLVEVHVVHVTGVVTLTVTDFGCWRTPKSDPGTRGHGLTLIRKLGDHTDVNATADGTTVRMTWRVPV